MDLPPTLSFDWDATDTLRGYLRGMKDWVVRITPQGELPPFDLRVLDADPTAIHDTPIEDDYALEGYVGDIVRNEFAADTVILVLQDLQNIHVY
jgi:hypothetical protein